MKKVWLILALMGISRGVLQAEVGVELTAALYNAGSGGFGSYTTWTSGTSAGDGYLGVHNTGTGHMNVKIQATNMSPSNWMLGTSPSQNIFTLQWGQTATQGVEPSWQLISTTSAQLFNVNAGATTKIDVRFRSPTSIDPVITQQQSSTITFSVQPLALTATNYTYLRKWGSQGSGDAQFETTRGIARDAAGTIYLLSYGDSGQFVKKFSPSGTFLKKWGGVYGSGDGQFWNPHGIAVDSSGNVYVADATNNRIQKFTSEGVFIRKWGTSGSGDGQFNVAIDVAVDSDGYVYVADAVNYRIQKFDADGNFIAKWGSQGSGDTQFVTISALAVRDGYVYVLDPYGSKVKKFNTGGGFVASWSMGGSNIYGIDVDEGGNVYVVFSYPSHFIRKFDSTGILIAQFGSGGSGDGQMNDPYDVAVDASGDVFVTDRNNYRIMSFAPQY